MKIIDYNQILKQTESKLGYPEVFFDTAGLNENWKIGNKSICTVPTWGKTPDNLKRRATLVISNYQDCIEFPFYYGKIYIQGVNIYENGQEQRATYMHSAFHPLIAPEYVIYLQRPVTQEEINKNQQRWKDYEAGTMTHAFNSQSDIFELAKHVFTLRFAGDWEFVVDSPFETFKLKDVQPIFRTTARQEGPNISDIKDSGILVINGYAYTRENLDILNIIVGDCNLP